MPLRERRDEDRALREQDVAADPVVQLRAWLADAVEAGVTEPNAMALATVDPTGRPSVRNVLLRGLTDDASLEFFTNRRSHKASDLAGNQHVAVLFSWLDLARQVRVSGLASTVGDERDDAYFATRPRESQIGAWASRQSSVIENRDALDRAVAEMEQRFEGMEVPRPPFWGGYSIRATEFEFWQGRAGRLHDRLRYWRQGSAWRLERLAP